MSDHLETEVKYAVQDPAALRRRLRAAGADLIRPRTREINLRWDNPAGELRAAGIVLRLRQDTQARLTLKLPVGPWGTEAKTLRELELEVSDFEVARQILGALGFEVWLTYEKYRETFCLAGVEISVDELPFGSFVEIEGSLEAIAAVARSLELEGAPRITAGYGALFYAARKRQGVASEACTFTAWQEHAGTA